MAFIQENLQILSTLGSALAFYIFVRIGAKRDVRELEKRIEKIEVALEAVNKNLHSLDMRLTRLEGKVRRKRLLGIKGMA